MPVRINSLLGQAAQFQQAQNTMGQAIGEASQATTDIIMSGQEAVAGFQALVNDLIGSLTQASAANAPTSRLQQAATDDRIYVTNEQVSEAIQDMMFGNTQILTDLVNDVLNQCKWRGKPHTKIMC